MFKYSFAFFTFCVIAGVHCYEDDSLETLVKKAFADIEDKYLENIYQMHETSSNFNKLALKKQQEIENKTEELLNIIKNAENLENTDKTQNCVIEIMNKNAYTLIDVTGCINVGYMRQIQSKLYKLSNLLKQIDVLISNCQLKDDVKKCVVANLDDYKSEAEILDKSIFQIIYDATLDTQKCVESTGNVEIRSIEDSIENLKNCTKM